MECESEAYGFKKCVYTYSIVQLCCIDMGGGGGELCLRVQNLVIHLSCTRKSNVPLISLDWSTFCSISIIYLPFFLPFVLCFFRSFSQPLRTVQQCSSVPISWIRKTSLAALTRSWCSTEVMRTERELAVFLTLMSRQESVSSFCIEINV